MAERIWAKGIYWNAPHANAPGWVVGKLGINRDRLVEWLQEQEVSEKGYLNLQITEKKGSPGEFNVELDQWKPSGSRESKAPSEAFDDDLDF